MSIESIQARGEYLRGNNKDPTYVGSIHVELKDAYSAVLQIGSMINLRFTHVSVRNFSLVTNFAILAPVPQCLIISSDTLSPLEEQLYVTNDTSVPMPQSRQIIGTVQFTGGAYAIITPGAEQKRKVTRSPLSMPLSKGRLDIQVSRPDGTFYPLVAGQRIYIELGLYTDTLLL